MIYLCGNLSLKSLNCIILLSDTKKIRDSGSRRTSKAQGEKAEAIVQENQSPIDVPGFRQKHRVTGHESRARLT